MKKLVILILALSFCILSCKHDVEELLYPPNSCDTSNVTYGITIVNIIKTNCYQCHGPNTINAPFSLDTYDALKARILDGKFWGAISHSPGFVPMPKDAPKLSSCDLAKIKNWLDQGYPNN